MGRLVGTVCCSRKWPWVKDLRVDSEVVCPLGLRHCEGRCVLYPARNLGGGDAECHSFRPARNAGTEGICPEN